MGPIGVMIAGSLPRGMIWHQRPERKAAVGIMLVDADPEAMAHDRRIWVLVQMDIAWRTATDVWNMTNCPNHVLEHESPRRPGFFWCSACGGWVDPDNRALDPREYIVAGYIGHSLIKVDLA